jgi:hypothetical protein
LPTRLQFAAFAHLQARMPSLPTPLSPISGQYHSTVLPVLPRPSEPPKA